MKIKKRFFQNLSCFIISNVQIVRDSKITGKFEVVKIYKVPGIFPGYPVMTLRLTTFLQGQNQGRQ